MAYITFDEYYGVNEYNSFINAAKNNKINYTEWINIRNPYNWYLEINDNDLPKFLDYDIATPQDERWMVKTILPRFPDEEYRLLRRSTDAPAVIEKFLVNDVFQEVKEKGHISFFRYRNNDELFKISSNIELKDSKIYKVDNVKSNWKVAICTNPFVESFIMKEYLLYSESNKNITKNPVELEAYLNYYIIKSDKMKNKYFQTSYVMNGKYYPFKQK